MSRPPRLDATRIVDAAFEVLDEAGIDGLNVRAIAARLGVQNPALYWHVKDKQTLVDLMATRLLGAARVQPRDGESAGAWLTRTVTALRDVLLSRRDGARLVASARVMDTEMGPLVDEGIRRLVAEGVPQPRAFFGTVAIFDYTLGATFERPQAPEGTPQLHLPALAAALMAAAQQGIDEDTGFRTGVQLLLAGIQGA